MNTCVKGFNGERDDPVSGNSHLGNGYRAYSPMLMRFHCPDAWSPFGTGGINPYAYCSGDPVNHADPSGHHSFWGWLGIGVGVVLGALLTPVSGGSSLAVALSAVSVSTAVVSVSLAVAQQFLEASDPALAVKLGWAALGTGVVSGLSSALLFHLTPGAQSLGSVLAGTRTRPFSNLMMEPNNGAGAARAPEAGFARQGRIMNLSRGARRAIRRYEEEAYEINRDILRLPPRRRLGINSFPDFGAHRQLLPGNIPVYSMYLQDNTPLPLSLQEELHAVYHRLGLPEENWDFELPDWRGGNNAARQTGPRQDAFGRPLPPSYPYNEFPAITPYLESHRDELLDYHYMTHL